MTSHGPPSSATARRPSASSISRPTSWTPARARSAFQLSVLAREAKQSGVPGIASSPSLRSGSSPWQCGDERKARGASDGRYPREDQLSIGRLRGGFGRARCAAAAQGDAHAGRGERLRHAQRALIAAQILEPEKRNAVRIRERAQKLILDGLPRERLSGGFDLRTKPRKIARHEGNRGG